MARRAWLEIVCATAIVAIVRDLTVAADLLLRERYRGYASLGVATIFAIWIVVLVAIALLWSRSGRPKIWPVPSTRTPGNALVAIGILVAVDWIYGFPLARIVAGQVALHLPASWFTFAVIAVAGPFVEEWVFRGLLWDAIASRTRGHATTLAPLAITSLLFGVSHCRWMLCPTWFTPSGTPITLHVAFGLCMAALRWRFRSIGPGVIVHGMWNALYPLTA